MIDLHIHSNYSDGESSVYEIAKRAKALNIKSLAIVDHSIEYSRGLNEKKAAMRLKEIDAAASTFDLKIYSGIECSIDVDGKILLPKFEFDFVVASVHECISSLDFYTRVLKCLENCEFQVLGHLFSDFFCFNEKIEELDLKLLELMREKDVAVEINSRHKCPDENFLIMADSFKIRYSIGSDAHSFLEVGKVGWSLEKAKRYMKQSKMFIP
ncbi:MAG: PHP domain-containing protein [Archaeoglobaceae archaeon]|nr:PHP domain-containing protein [Archaeoglobaceae archaeon]MCX8152163.1 PHP domain-containing protein [Archaeoglobaceae archaeon]MDW8013879.1 PHP domain-containing protein [Archaeoglobaceae archaeon]